MTWHQFWSSSSVVTTMSARAAPGDRSLTVTMAVRAPAVRHAASAAFVAGVPPSWETPITRPLLTGSSDSSSAWTLASVAVGRPAVRSASRRISTPASDPCSDVPQPVTRIGWPAAAASRIAAASPAAGPDGAARDVSRRLATPGSASIISVMWYGGPGRSEGIPVLAHGSGGPGSGASGSKATSLMAASIRAPGDGADDDSPTDTAPCPG